MTCEANLPGLSLAEMCGASTLVVFLSLLDELVRSNEKISGACERIKPIETPDHEYDFVVIGGGGAGAVVAGRLSENSDWKVLLLEAGGDEPVGGQIPLFTSGLHGTIVDWNYTTSYESYACLALNGSCPVTAGKLLGGCTAHNAMNYIRGNPTDFNNWADDGNEGWTWDEVKPFYLKSEDNGEIERVGRHHHSTGGPLSVERFPYVPPIAQSILDASAEIGYGLTEDLNGDQITGFTITQTASKKGVRRSSSRSFLWPARNRENLHVSLNSLATRVIIENHDAVGVEYYKNGELKTVRVSREVVLSAGTIRSPQVLLLSGVGPKKHLRSMGIKVVKDAPGVGENYHDHIACNLDFTIDEPNEYDADWKAAFQYLVNQTGPLSVVGSFSVLGMLNTKSSSPDYPNVQLHFSGYTYGCAPGQVGALHSPGKRAMGIHASTLHPESRGKITLASTDPLQYPVIHGNYLSDPRDVEALVDALEMGLAMADTRALQAHNFTFSTTPIEACSEFVFPGRDYWACAIRQNSISDYHMVGTCKMGPQSDPMAVVDPRLRVHGINGLRVADASIMPKVTSGNTAAPTMMIGERAADFIKKDWARKHGVKPSTQRNPSKCNLKRKATK